MNNSFLVTFYFRNYEGKSGGFAYEKYETKEAMNADLREFLTDSKSCPKGVQSNTEERRAISKRLGIPMQNLLWSIDKIDISLQNLDASAIIRNFDSK